MRKSGRVSKRCSTPRWQSAGHPKPPTTFSGIVEYIRRDNPIAARRVATEIYERAVASLNAFPYSGRPGRVQGTRELPLPPLPFVVVYRVRDDAVEIANILHGAQKWP